MCPIYAVLAAPLVRPLRIPLVLWFTHWRASRLLQAAERASTAVTSVDERSFRSFEEAQSHRSRHRRRGVPVRATPRRRDAPARARALLDREGARRRARRRQAGRTGRRAPRPRPSLSDEERHHRAELEQLSTELELDGRLVLGDAVPPEGPPGLFASHDALVNNMRAGAPDKVVYEAAAGASPSSRRTRSSIRSSTPGSASPAGTERPRRGDPHVGGDERGRARGDGPKAPPAGRGRPLGAVVGAWDPGSCRARDMTGGIVVHTQKVAGISGSEACLLQLLPDLRERGWDVRFLMLHEDEPGAGVRARAHEPGCAARRHSTARRRRPDRVRRGRRLSRRARAPGSSTRTSFTRTSTASSPARSRGYRSGSRRSTASTSSGKGAGSGLADRSVGLLAHVHCNLAGARPLPRGDGGLRRGGLRDRPLRDLARTTACVRTRERSRGSCASAA